jgi:hypothetical protein
MQEHKAWRNAEIYARRCSGLTLKAIAHEIQLSKETVREIARRDRLPPMGIVAKSGSADEFAAAIEAQGRKVAAIAAAIGTKPTE